MPTIDTFARSQVSVSKEHITIVGDGSTQADVEARVKQIKNLVAEVRFAQLSAHVNCASHVGSSKVSQEQRMFLKRRAPLHSCVLPLLPPACRLRPSTRRRS